MVPPSADEWWRIDEPDEPDAPPEPVTLANAVGTLFNSDLPFEVLRFQDQKVQCHSKTLYSIH
ncbi:MAG: hypothetical protein CM15mP105_0260 [Methanobacteriota archaeon]|nr:MAG: hypothetical protein CM15mP105_0260 [Euryarchaeota archaeon]